MGEKERDRLITSEPLIIGVVSMGIEGGNREFTLVSGAGVCGLSDFLDNLLFLGGGSNSGGNVIFLVFCSVGKGSAVFSVGVCLLPLVRVREVMCYAVCCFHHFQMAVAVVGVQWR